ncbi:hypothetical protein BO94DRAFT_310118 [Aspergillus sclerotioniger CBS 115572]|uniref:Uncharacterized protein n=1 Tax=Aspergillus sclerotioniger CBS 115572 TaxID=1450535 RepID=A0A317V399_9EURO|nr:hypothetical protein BO94DRAFT_310118 [Aspergillus sclerotioniger CBS 115572]PWY67282.1 hypothetical protein BO94DRAFT_310118 [Aspergillus sclerotioniger CBS 115572]
MASRSYGMRPLPGRFVACSVRRSAGGFPGLNCFPDGDDEGERKLIFLLGGASSTKFSVRLQPRSSWSPSFDPSGTDDFRAPAPPNTWGELPQTQASLSGLAANAIPSWIQNQTEAPTGPLVPWWYRGQGAREYCCRIS